MERRVPLRAPPEYIPGLGLRHRARGGRGISAPNKGGTASYGSSLQGDGPFFILSKLSRRCGRDVQRYGYGGGYSLQQGSGGF